MKIKQLCSWALVHIVKSVKKRVLVVLSTLSILYVIIRWKLMCIDIHSQIRIQNIVS